MVVPGDRSGSWTAGRERIDAALRRRFPGADDRPQGVSGAVRYTLLAPGKRVRGLLVLVTNEALLGPEAAALDLAGVVECVHAASLILDDLPSMDNATLRRGRPTLHRVVGEATAILAALALLNDSFRWLQEMELRDGARRAITLALTASIGPQGLIGGQAADLDQTANTPDTKALLQVRQHKTVALFQFAVEAAGLAAAASADTLGALRDYAEGLGTAYQITDDLLADGSVEVTGKDAGLDRGKITAVDVYGAAGALHLAQARVQTGLESLRRVGLPQQQFGAIAAYVLERAKPAIPSDAESMPVSVTALS